MTNSNVCPRCGKTFQPSNISVSCAVMHQAGDCCHYGQTEVHQLPNEPDKIRIEPCACTCHTDVLMTCKHCQPTPDSGTPLDHTFAMADELTKELRQAERLQAFKEVLEAIHEMDNAYPEAGRKVSRGEIIKWLEHELGRGKK